MEHKSYIVENLCLIYLCYSLFKLKGRVMGPMLALVCPCLRKNVNSYAKSCLFVQFR